MVAAEIRGAMPRGNMKSFSGEMSALISCFLTKRVGVCKIVLNREYQA